MCIETSEMWVYLDSLVFTLLYIRMFCTLHLFQR
ncbi:hypothetical protein AALP_AA8G476600 [Arabis alpina]|uniref:Uncharacterized protein n=1 Tax=Arabis alpina TaxID=50452 RepID=A0A087GE31_ARAAL|nr:hypothetical protein AALP_AA8G476600 [Arabis alpina]